MFTSTTSQKFCFAEKLALAAISAELRRMGRETWLRLGVGI
jgi:hypothetical protein